MYTFLFQRLSRKINCRFLTTKPIQFYSLATPNGQKIGIALEELGLEYDAHLIDISKNIQYGKKEKQNVRLFVENLFFLEDWFKKLNPNSKIPVLIDRQPNTNDNKPITIFESGAILIYLADKTGRFLAPMGTNQRYETIAWLMWQMSGVGPMFGQANHFHRAAKEQIDYAKQRYLDESKRLLKVLDTQLNKTNAFVSGNDYTIADMAIFPWVKFFLKYYHEKLNETKYSNVEKWVEMIGNRSQVIKGLRVCSKND